MSEKPQVQLTREVLKPFDHWVVLNVPEAKYIVNFRNVEYVEIVPSEEEGEFPLYTLYLVSGKYLEFQPKDEKQKKVLDKLVFQLRQLEE